MPLKTFDNLPEERKTEILHISLAEFAEHDYASASLSRIIRKLDIAKGSFYRYFDSKQDLFRYLFDFCRNLFYEKIDTYLKKPDSDFFQAWLDLNVATMNLERDHPNILGFLAKASRMNWEMLTGDTEGERAELRQGYLADILKFHRERGKIRKDIPLDILAYSLMGLREGMKEFLSARYDHDFKTGFSFYTKIPPEEIREVLAPFIKIMRDALGSEEGNNEPEVI